MTKITAEQVKALPEGTHVFVGKVDERMRLEYELTGTGRRQRLIGLPHRGSYLPIKDRKGWGYYVEEKGEE